MTVNEFILTPGNSGRALKYSDKCHKCQKKFYNRDKVISRSIQHGHAVIYHKECWENCFI